MYSPGTGGTKKPVHFTESGVSHFRGYNVWLLMGFNPYQSKTLTKFNILNPDVGLLHEKFHPQKLPTTLDLITRSSKNFPYYSRKQACST